MDFEQTRVTNALAEKENIDHDVADELIEMYFAQGLTLAHVIHQHNLDMENF